jgi:hypothetical protein
MGSFGPFSMGESTLLHVRVLTKLLDDVLDLATLVNLKGVVLPLH